MKQITHEFKKRFTDDLEGYFTVFSTQPNVVTITVMFLKTLDTEIIFKYIEKNKHFVAGIATFAHEDDGSITLSTEVSSANAATAIKQFLDNINHLIKVSYDNLLDNDAFVDAVANEIQKYIGE